MKPICRILNDGKFESASNNEFILDSNYGYMKNDGIITYSIENNDVEITVQETEKAFWIAGYEWTLDTPIHFMHIREFRKKFNNPTAKPMIRVIFRSEEEDEILNSSTIAYMGYPLEGSTFYGLLVLNKRYHFNLSGNPISGNEMKKLGINVQYEDDIPRYSTMDLDKIFRHELGHGVYGLPHSTSRNKTMSSNEGDMAEHNTDEDILRAQNKAGKSTLPEKWKKQIRKFFHIWTE